MLERDMERKLKTLSFHVFELCASRALSRMGYRDVQLQGRRRTRQKSYLGGCDLVAFERLGPFPIKTVVKLVQDDVRIRMIDELKGALPRLQAHFGILMTPHGYTTQTAELAGKPHPRVAVLTGKEIAALMVREGIGVCGAGQQTIDHVYFDQLEVMSEKLLSFVEELRREGGA